MTTTGVYFPDSFGPSSYSETKCAGPVRWFEVGTDWQLQQLYLVTDYEGGQPVRQHQDWRPVEWVRKHAAE
jgi:hypothetical protein